MALNAEVLAELAYLKYQTNMRDQFPEAVKKRVVVERPRADGSTDYSFSEEVGPIEVKREDIMPLLSALAEAIVEHINEHAVVENVYSGSVTRNVL